MYSWYETTSPSQTEVETTMQNSEFYLCLHKSTNTPEEDAYLQKIVSDIIIRVSPLSSPGASYMFKTITYHSIRQNPKWKEMSNAILREEVIAQKPYGSWRGFSTFVFDTLRKKYILRVVREIWAACVLHTTFAQIWLAHNYCPMLGQGYKRTKQHYETMIECK
jgi:hypothetical protein